MMADNKKILLCENCSQSFDQMKRCTRCRLIYYCSRNCQMDDWPKHKDMCGGSSVHNKNTVHIPTKDIFTEQEPTKDMPIHNVVPAVNFEKAFKDLNTEVKTDSNNIKGFCVVQNTEIQNGFYYYNNQSCFDVPVFDKDSPFTNIGVKCDKIKLKLDVNNTWTGDQLFKYLCSKLEIPLEKIKIINKGKVLARETICGAIAPKAMFQVIGEKSANEEGLNKTDIDVMMTQLGIERNSAVKTLRQKGDLIDAILEAGNK